MATAATVAPETVTRRDEERERRDRFWRAVDRIGEPNKDEDPDEVPVFVTEIVEEVHR